MDTQLMHPNDANRASPPHFSCQTPCSTLPLGQMQGGMNGQPGQNQQGQFSSPAMQASDANRASPPHPSSQSPGSMQTQQGGMQTNGQGVPAGRRPMTFLELKARA